MKIHIAFTFQPGAYGGGNQFLKALRAYLQQSGVYTNQFGNADVILFSSHHDFHLLLQHPGELREKVLVHRVDGPMRLYNSPDDYRDLLVNTANSILADGTIFQSRWSRDKGLKMGLEYPVLETTIPNAPDPAFFYRKNMGNPGSAGKIRIIASAWSVNTNKGFDDYCWLDENLDFSRFEMTFVGNTPVSFNNINIHSPVESSRMGQLLREHDIYITASRSDPCSNSLLEALHSGLPVLAVNSGGHPELVAKGGELFDTVEEVPDLLTRLVHDYQRYQQAIQAPPITDIGSRYVAFCRHVKSEADKRGRPLKFPSGRQLDILRGMVDKRENQNGKGPASWKRLWKVLRNGQ